MLLDPRRGGRLRPGVQGQPAAAHRGRRGGGRRRACATGPSTPSPPIMPPMRPRPRTCPFDQAPPGMLGLQTALPIAWQVLSPTLGPERHLRADEHAAGRHRRPDGDRRPAGRAQRPRRSDRGRARRPTSASSTRRPRPWSIPPAWPAAAATRRMPVGRFIGRGAPHGPARRAGRDRRGGPAMTAARATATAAGAAGDRRRRGLRGRGGRRDAPRWPPGSWCSTPP